MKEIKLVVAFANETWTELIDDKNFVKRVKTSLPDANLPDSLDLKVAWVRMPLFLPLSLDVRPYCRTFRRTTEDKRRHCYQLTYCDMAINEFQKQLSLNNPSIYLITTPRFPEINHGIPCDVTLGDVMLVRYKNWRDFGAGFIHELYHALWYVCAGTAAKTHCSSKECAFYPYPTYRRKVFCDNCRTELEKLMSKG